MNAEEIMLKAASIPGWMTAVELRWLMARAGSLKTQATWCEIGVYCGRSLFAVGLSLPFNSTLIGIDYTLFGKTDRLAVVLDDLIAWRPDLNLILHRQTSRAAARHVPDAVCDVVFVDGDHSHAGCRTDIELYRPKIKPEGMLAGHDYSASWPGVTQAVDELLPSRAVLTGGSIWWSGGTS